MIGNQTGSTTRGAIIGAVVGGAAGAIIGHQMDQRAKDIESADRYLARQGVDRDMATAGLGEREPVSSNTTEAGCQRNRRVEIAICASAALQEDARREVAGR